MYNFLRPFLISLLLLASAVGIQAQNNNSSNKKEKVKAPQGNRALTVTDIMKFRQVESPSISKDL